MSDYLIERRATRVLVKDQRTNKTYRPKVNSRGRAFLTIDGVRLVVDVMAGTVEPYRQIKPCPYLGQPREETYTLRQVCKTCNGKKESVITLIVHDCAKQGRCLPGWRCNNAITEEELAGEPATACRQCEFNPNNRSPDNG